MANTLADSMIRCVNRRDYSCLLVSTMILASTPATRGFSMSSSLSSSSTSSFSAPPSRRSLVATNDYGSLPMQRRHLHRPWWHCDDNDSPISKSPTQRFMSTSIPSGDRDVSETSSVFDGDGGYDGEEEGGDDEGEDDNDDDDDEDESAALLEDHAVWTKAVVKAAKALEKKRTSLQAELTKAEGAESTAARAQLLVNNLYLFKEGATTAVVNDWDNNGAEVELTLSGDYSSASAEADALFAKVRKLKRGSKIVAGLLDETECSWDTLEGARADLESALTETDVVDEGRLALVKDRLLRTARTTKFQPPTKDADDTNSRGSKQAVKQRRDRKAELGTPASNVRKLLSPGGCVVLVGRNRRGNEYLSMTVARGNDVWMHSRGCPGAHVILQNRRGSPTPTEQCYQFGADLAIFYSDLRNEQKASVTLAQPKHIQKPRGAPLGAVKLREELKTMVGFPNDVPDSLKEARDASGQSDEYRVLDKAKHRKRTSRVAAEDKVKRRKQKRKQRNNKKQQEQEPFD